MSYKTDIDNNNQKLENNNLNIQNIIQQVANISTYSDITATEETVLDGKTYYGNGTKRTGTMNNIGQQVITPSVQVQNITEGYHNGLGYVEAVTSNIDSNIQSENIKEGISILNVEGSLKDTSDASATEDDILLNKTAYVNNEKLTGTFDVDALYDIIDDDHTTVVKEDTVIDINDAIQYKAPLNIKGNTSQATSILPEGYTQLDYIESTGTQYIDTLLKGNNNTEIFLKVNSISGGSIVGDITSKDVGISIYYSYDNPNAVSRFGNRSGTGILKDYNYNTLHIIKTNKNGIYIDDTLLHSWGTVASFETAETMLLFRARNSTMIGTQQIYSCKIYDNDILVRDFIPCKNANNEVGLYDLVSNTFFANAGTGDFVAGGVAIIPNPYYPQEVNGVTGNNKIILTGDNLLNPNKYVPKTARESYIEYKDEVFTVIKANYNTQSYIFNNLKLDPIKFEDGFTFFAIVEGTHASGNLIFYDIEGEKIGSELIINTSNTKKVFRKHFITKVINSIKWFDPKNTVGTTYKFFILSGDVSITDAEFIRYAGKEFEVNLGNIELYKIGEYEDIIFKNEQSSKYYNSNLIESAWYILQRVQKLLSNGSETTWSVNATYDDAILYRRNLPANVQKIDGLYNIIATNLPTNGNNGEYSIMGQTVGKHIQIRLSKKYAGDVTEFRQWLTENNVYSYYPLVTPTYIQITDETLIAQLEALHKFRTEHGVNHIWTDAEESEPNLELSYKKQIEYQDKSVTPTTSQQTIIADTGYEALNQVTINAVNSDIDTNIIPRKYKITE